MSNRETIASQQGSPLFSDVTPVHASWPYRLKRAAKFANSHRRIVVTASTILLLILIAIFAPLIAPHDPEFMDYSQPLAGPSADHLLGTDQFGRDVLTRVIYGARLSLQISFYAVTLAFIVGVSFGLVSAYFGSYAEMILMRLTDILLVIPGLILAIAVVAFIGASLANISAVIAIIYVPIFARLTFVVSRAVRNMAFVESARAIGANDARIILRAILPNALAPLIVQVSLSLGFAILTESGLSFLGVGVPPPAPSWGGQIAEARLTLAHHPLLAIWPSIVITTTILSFNILGDALRDLMDPRLR